jgi:hypothetical protein
MKYVTVCVRRWSESICVRKEVVWKEIFGMAEKGVCFVSRKVDNPIPFPILFFWRRKYD